MIQLAKNHRYLLQEVNYTQYRTIREYLILEVTEGFYKIKNMIGDNIFWIGHDEIKGYTHGSDGYFVLEDLGDISDPKQSK